MKFIVEQSDLNTNLALVSRAIPSRPTHPVLAYVLLVSHAENQTVQLTGFDLSFGIWTSLSARVEASGTLCLPAKLLHDIVAAMPNGEITLNDETASGMVSLISQSGSYKMRCISSEEFPALPAIASDFRYHLSAKTLIEGLRGTLFATSDDETKQILAGVHLKFQKDGIEFAATDGYRLAVVETLNPSETTDTEENLNSQIEEFELTIPARSLRELERMVGMGATSADAIALYFDCNQIVFEDKYRRLTTRILEGSYPNYRQLIPRTFERSITINRRSLLKALERIGVLAEQKNRIIKFNIDSLNQQVFISIDCADVGSAQESLPAEVSGESLEIAFNIKYLVSSLKALDTDEIQVHLNASHEPIIITRISQSSRLMHLVMPLQLKTSSSPPSQHPTSKQKQKEKPQREVAAV